MEPLYQGSKDVFLARVRADFDALENQALTSFKMYQTYSLMGTNPMADSLFVNVSEVTDDGDRAVWRHVATSGVEGEGTRQAGGKYPRATFIRGYETAIFDPDEQIANEFKVPEERQDKEGKKYATVLNRAQKILIKMNRTNIQDPFEVFNLAFSAPSVLPNRFFVRGNAGLDGNQTALGERLVSISHARADGGTTQSNAAQASGNARVFSDDAYFAAREQGAAFKDDIGDDTPRFGGAVTIIIPPANGLVRQAMEINGSNEVVGSANNEINVHKGLFGRVVSTPSLLASKYVSTITDTSKWFLVDEVSRDPETGAGLVCITFVPMTTKVERDNEHDSIVYKIKQTKSYGFVDWRNVIGSKGDNATYSS